MLFLIVFSLALTNTNSIVTPSTGGLVPQPSSVKYLDGALSLSTNLTIKPSQSCPLLDAAIARAKTNIFAKGSNPAADGVFSELTIDVKTLNCSGYPSLKTDESYSLSVTTDGTGTLTANEVWGALHGLETFSQLTYTPDLGETQEDRTICYIFDSAAVEVLKTIQAAIQFFIKPAVITDSPRFKHRGVMLDTSRHFLSLKYLKLNLDLMAQNKFNVFHWHVVDDQSFPFESTTFPQLSAKGAFTPNHVYSPKDVQDVIEHARQRGIRVVPEFDTPGHVESWGNGLPDLLTKCYDTKTGKPDGNLGPIDPTLMSTYDTILALFTEVFNVFKDNYVHLGGDEVPYGCWESNPRIQQFATQMGWTDFGKLQSYYTQSYWERNSFFRLLDLIKRAGGDDAEYIVWEEVFTRKNKVRNDTIIHVWRGENDWAATMAAVTKAGLHGLLSSCWYLNYVHYGIDWAQYYKCDPQNFEGTEAQKELVIGGEACMWGEYVDSTNVIARLWPRASVVAERLWSPKNYTDADAFAHRLEEHRCRLIRRGYQVESVNGPGFCGIEYE